MKVFSGIFWSRYCVPQMYSGISQEIKTLTKKATAAHGTSEGLFMDGAALYCN